jgi:hypothetical protein
MMSLFKHSAAKQAPAEALPASLEAAIQGMSVAHRGTHEGEQRIMLAFAGETTVAWHHSEAETKRRLAAAWPELTDEQLVRACRAVNGLIRARGDGGTSNRKRSEWAAWQSARKPIFE